MLTANKTLLITGTIAIILLVFFVLTACSSKKKSSKDNDTRERITVKSLYELQNAIDEAKPEGAVITLAAGRHEQAAQISINNKSNITIQGETSDYKDTVILAPGIDNPSIGISFRLDASDHITLKNLTIRDVYYHCLQLNNGSDYFTGDNLCLLNAGEGALKTTSPKTKEGPWCDYGTVKNSFIGYEDGIAGTRDFSYGIEPVAAKGWKIIGNRFENIKNAGGATSYGFYNKANTQDSYVEGNIFKNCFIAIGFGGSGSKANTSIFRDWDNTYNHRNGIVKNNLIISTENTGILMQSADNFKIYNNTIWDTGSSAIDVYLNSSGTIYNNIMKQDISYREGGRAETGNNLVNADSDLFKNPGGEDFHLVKSAKKAIKMGKNLKDDVPVDLDGKKRPSKGAFDLGACQY